MAGLPEAAIKKKHCLQSVVNNIDNSFRLIHIVFIIRHTLAIYVDIDCDRRQTPNIALNAELQSFRLAVNTDSHYQCKFLKLVLVSRNLGIGL